MDEKIGKILWWILGIVGLGAAFLGILYLVAKDDLGVLLGELRKLDNDGEEKFVAAIKKHHSKLADLRKSAPTVGPEYAGCKDVVTKFPVWTYIEIANFLPAK